MKAQDIYEKVTADMISAIEQGIADPNGWQKPWSGGQGTAIRFNQANATTGKRYAGINTLILGITAYEKSFTSNQWATFKQWEASGEMIRKGEKAAHCIKWTVLGDRCRDHKGKQRCHCGFATGFAVFNREQLQSFVPAEVEPVADVDPGVVFDALDAFTAAAERDGLTISFRDSDSAFYDQSLDRITLPLPSQFSSPGGFYATQLHEMAHASGHGKRLEREFGKRFGDQKYAMEELCAELAAAFMGASIGVVDDAEQVQHGNYLANWLKVLKADAKALAHVAGKAQAAADYWESRAAAVLAESQESELVA